MNDQFEDTPLNRDKKFFLQNSHDIRGMQEWVKTYSKKLEEGYNPLLARLIEFVRTLINLKLNPIPQNHWYTPAEFDLTRYNNVT